MYRVLIEKIQDVDYVSREYEKLADSGNKQDGGAVYGYVECPATKTETTEIYVQSLDEIDLPAIIKATNKM